MEKNRTERTLTIDDDVSIEQAMSLYNLEDRFEDVDDVSNDTMVDGSGNVISWISREVKFYEVDRTTTRKANERWFECPVTGEWLPISEGVTYRGVLYSQEAAMDLIEDRRRSAL